MSVGIAHISDLHLSTNGAREIFDSHVVNDIKAFKPSLIIVTGDLVDHPSEEVFEEVRERLQGLCETCGISEPERLIVIPGNHDYRYFGMFWKKASLQGTGFETVFPDWQKPRFFELDGQYISIFSFDSNTNDPRINFARGKVGQAEFGRFSRQHNELKGLHNANFDKSYKIALLHHHPLPIAQTETGRITDNDVFLGLEDAGTFMQELIEKKINLVLHGHKHFPFFARVKFITALYEEKELTILAAGSTCKPGLGAQGNGYNLITLKDNRTIEVVQRFRDTSGAFKARKPIEVLNYDMYREKRYREEREQSKYHIDLERHNILIDEFGDSECQEEYRNFRVNPNKECDGFPVSSRSFAGTFKGFSAFSRSQAIADPRWKADKESCDRSYKGRIDFGKPITSDTGPISFDTRYHHFNAFALDKEQGIRLYGEDDPEYYVSYVSYPIGTLLMTIRFPSEIKTSAFDVVVWGENKTHNTDEETHCRPFLHISELTSTATLIVQKPLLNYSYGISWQLPAKPRKTSAQGEGNARLIRNKLLELDLRPDPTLPAKHPLQEVFETIRQELLESYPSKDPYAHFDVVLFVYDDKLRRLRPVAGVIPPAFWDFHPHEGEGVGGRAHKLNSAHLYVRDMVTDDIDWYISPPSATAPHKVLFAVPLRYPIPPGIAVGATEGSVIGVFCVGTTSPGSELLRLYVDKTDEDTEGEGDRLIAKIHEDYFLKRILPALGLQNLG